MLYFHKTSEKLPVYGERVLGLFIHKIGLEGEIKCTWRVVEYKKTCYWFDHKPMEYDELWYDAYNHREALLGYPNYWSRLPSEEYIMEMGFEHYYNYNKEEEK